MNEVAPIHFWPLGDQGHHRFTLGRLVDCTADVIRAYANERLATHPGVGLWECELDREEITWSDETYDIFGVPRGVPVTRAEALTYYCDLSRAALERLRAEAVEHKMSFVLDAQIRPGHGTQRLWMRVVGAPVSKNGKVVSLRGFKQII